MTFPMTLIATGMTSSSLTALAPHQVLQLAVQLADPTVGLPANQIQWLSSWAETLNAQQLKALTGKQLCCILQLLAGPPGSSTDTAAASSPGGAPSRPSEQLLALLCWCLADHVGSCSGEEVYRLVTALAGWQYVPPNGTVLLGAAAARLAEKLPVLSQLQVAHALRSFAQLNFKVGEPLQSKLCDRLMQAAAKGSSSSGSNSSSKGPDRSAATMQHATESAEVLGAVLMALPEPQPALVQQLMQQLSEQLLNVPPRTLLELGQGLAAAGLPLTRQPADNGAGGTSRGAAARLAGPELLVRFGLQYLAAAGRVMPQLVLGDLAALCSTLQQLGLAADADIAQRVVHALQQQLPAVGGSSLAVTAAAEQPSQITAVVDYVTASGFRPNSVVITSVEELLLGWLQGALDQGRQPQVLMTAVAGNAGLYVSAEHERQDQLAVVLLPADLARLLLCLNKWGRRHAGAFAVAAYDWSRHRLTSASASTLGPLLLGLCTVCGRPSTAWLSDWDAVTLSQFSQSTPADLAAVAVAAAEAGAAGSLSSRWMEQLLQAVQQQLQGFSALDLESVASSLYLMRARPSRDWLSHLLAEADRRGAATDTPTARALAYVQQLKVKE
jgi:hypothetical protein